NRLLNPERQTRRLEYLWRYGEFRVDGQDRSASRRFAQMHRARFNHLEEEGVADDNYLEKHQ
ncbi:MAG TPA: hypothetical protein VK400_10775, partial [Pyrinomonadaceae bacterium]|nr:hypothetical protein [Pyrinomonadaceae bacterium]